MNILMVEESPGVPEGALDLEPETWVWGGGWWAASWLNDLRLLLLCLGTLHFMFWYSLMSPPHHFRLYLELLRSFCHEC